MKFSDLLNLPHDDAGNIDVPALQQALPETPLAVLNHVYSSHGRNDDFQRQYRNLRIDQISWSEEVVAANELIRSSIYPDFMRWFEGVAARANDFDRRSWDCIDIREAVRDQWSSRHTWLEPPFFLVGSMVGSTSELHLFEGHTRVGTLKGLVHHGHISSESTHLAWIGSRIVA